MSTPEEIVRFWFGGSLANDAVLDAHVDRWFRGDREFDLSIARRFAGDIEQAGRGELDDWTRSPRGRLALIILLDQFSRNAFRGSNVAYAFDAQARELSREGLAIGADRDLAPIERNFFYLPLLHSERLADQDLSVECFKRLLAQAPSLQMRYFTAWLKLARRQRIVIRCFGRFPHRNAVLGRKSTSAERAFLAMNSLRANAARALRRVRRRPGISRAGGRN